MSTMLETPEVFSVGWGTLALINAALAQVKNHLVHAQDSGGLFWFILSLFIGPLATICIVLFKDPS